MTVLNETEIAILEILSSEGSKTVPEIKGRIHRSKNHTSRLMRKLCEVGYLREKLEKKDLFIVSKLIWKNY